MKRSPTYLGPIGRPLYPEGTVKPGYREGSTAMIRVVRFGIWVWMGFLTASSAMGVPVRFQATSGSEKTRVEFESKAPLETFRGHTTQASGQLILDPTALGDSLQVVVEVDMASLDTGINKRNQDMRENHLETDRFPTATFRGGHLVGAHPNALPPGEPVDLEVAGTFTLHGVAREVRWAVTLTYTDDGPQPSIRVTSQFPVTLADHEITRPRFLFMKLGETQQVTVDISFTSTG